MFSGSPTRSRRISRASTVTGGGRAGVMERDRRRAIALIAGACVFAFGGVAWRLAPRAFNARRLRSLAGRRVYDEGADASALLADALGRAARAQRRVLVVLGGNW